MNSLSPCLPKLMAWFRERGRKFVWRETRDWYVVLLAEFMLVRTRASVVDRVLKEVIRKYPSPKDMCLDGERAIEFLQSVFRRIGLVKRAPWLYEAVCAIHRGEVNVCNFKDLIKLKGVGNYIASVMVSRVCNANEPFIDTNVRRVLTRCLGIEISDKDARRIIASLGAPVVELCFALIDIAFEFCKPKRPRCEACPLAGCCLYASRINVG